MVDRPEHNRKNGKADTNGHRPRPESVNGYENNGQPKTAQNGTATLPRPKKLLRRSAHYHKRAFAALYIGPAKGNATEAARLLGLKCPENAGYRLLKDDEVQALIAKQLDDAALSATEVLSLLSEAAEGPSAEFFDPETGVPDLLRIVRSRKTHLLRRVVPTKHGLSVEFVDAQAAQIALAKYHGLLVERVQVSVNVTEYDDPAQLAAIERGEDPGPPRKRSSSQSQQAQLESGPTVIETTGTLETEHPDKRTT